MMRLVKKLHNQRGASILVALMFFLVCAMAAAVILGSATTNAEKIQRRQKGQQVYYSVSSAAQLLRDKVNNLTITGSEVFTQYDCNNLVLDTDESISPDREPNTAAVQDMAAVLNGAAVTGDVLIDLLSDGVRAVYTSTLAYAEKTPFISWKKSFTIEDGQYTVDVTVSIDEDYTFTFQLVPEDQDLEGDYSMTLTCAGKKSNPDIKKEPGGTCSHEVTQKNYKTGELETFTKEFDITVTTRTTSIGWEPGMIYKGADSHG